MAEKLVKGLGGVGGVLSKLLSEPEPVQNAPATPPRERPQEAEEAPRVRMTEPPEEQPPPSPSKTPAVVKEASPRKKAEARRGRPPAGARTSEPVEREKVSLRLRADLAAAYRDWSWEERCQFSDLVDRALESYLKSRRKARKPETE